MSTIIQPISAHDHAEGPADAPLILIEYGDYQCPYCGAAYPVIKRLQKKLGKTLRFVFRNFPLTQAHPYALISAEAAEAAALQGKFWEMHDLMFQQQTLLKPEIIPSWAKRIGLNLDKVKNDIKQDIVEKRIRKIVRAASAAVLTARRPFLLTEHATMARRTMIRCWRLWSPNWRYAAFKYAGGKRRIEMLDNRYTKDRTALLFVDAYNDVFSDGGKLWPLVEGVASLPLGTPAELEVIFEVRMD